MASLAPAAVADERTQTVFALAGFCLDVGRGSLSDPRGAALALRSKTFDLLTYLFRNPGRIVSRDELMDAVWPSIFVTDDSLTCRCRPTLLVRVPGCCWCAARATGSVSCRSIPGPSRQSRIDGGALSRTSSVFSVR